MLHSHPEGPCSQSPYRATRIPLVGLYSTAQSHPIHHTSKTLENMRFDILAACMIAYPSSSLAAPLPTDPLKGSACLAPSQPDRKVNAYPAKHPAPLAGIAPPEPPKRPETPDMHEQEHRGPTIALPVLHRKITMHDEVQDTDAQSD